MWLVEEVIEPDSAHLAVPAHEDGLIVIPRGRQPPLRARMLEG
jgi:hypothetical protein